MESFDLEQSESHPTDTDSDTLLAQSYPCSICSDGKAKRHNSAHFYASSLTPTGITLFKKEVSTRLISCASTGEALSILPAYLFKGLLGPSC